MALLSFLRDLLLETLDLEILFLKFTDSLRNVHPQPVHLVDLAVSFLEEGFHLHLFVAGLGDQVLDVSLLLLVLCEYVEVLELHALILSGDLFDVLLGLLVLAELTN